MSTRNVANAAGYVASGMRGNVSVAGEIPGVARSVPFVLSEIVAGEGNLVRFRSSQRLCSPKHSRELIQDEIDVDLGWIDFHFGFPVVLSLITRDTVLACTAISPEEKQRIIPINIMNRLVHIVPRQIKT